MDQSDISKSGSRFQLYFCVVELSLHVVGGISATNPREKQRT
jgi:hypothetical protein